MIIPLTLGGLLQKPLNGSDDPFTPFLEHDGETFWHPILNSTIVDIFRKVDLVLNRQLDAEELNQLGDITNMDYFKNIEEEDFLGPDFKDISCDKNGLTLYGFKQVLMKLSQEERN